MPKPEQSTCAIVGIGASAGGLDALRRLLGALPANPPFALVVVQHLDPSTRSMLAEIIDRSCDLKVVRARSGSVLAPGTVYVVPEGREPFVENGRLQLGKRSKTCSEPIDTLFASLATHNHVGGCGVVLSGNGADGTIGLRKIRGAGGLTFAQDPSTAEFPGMPSAAVEAGVADFVGSPEQIARDLMAHLRYEALGGPPITTRKSKAAADREAKARDRILALIRVDSGMDFSGYKTTTVMRRIHRRVMLGDAQSLEAYSGALEADAAERAALFDDLLINVTEFFRDADVFEALRTRVFPKVLKSKADEDTLRIWVVGCSTGEEVYSILITALEAMEAAGSPRKVTVFGTDASESSIARARAGVYPQSICASVSPERLSRYFVRTDAGFEIDRALRDMCVFARQDITKDTPFSRLDLVSLRNVLIYMDQPLQSQVLSVAHFALQPDGVLLLGTSETPETEARLFRAYDKQNHVYRRQDVAPRLPVDIANAARATIGSVPVASPGFAFDDIHDAHKAADEVSLLLYAPPRVVADADGHILHFFGDTSPYLEHAAGRATLDVNEMAQPGIALELKDALQAANSADGSATRAASFVSGGKRRHVSIEITPLPSPTGSPQLMVAFREIAAGPTSGAPANNEDLARLYEAREQRVRGELGAMRGRLRTVAEEKEQVNQSLRSANEEIRSSNEELQSINEELETAKEELQSANEELITVNDELRHSNRDLGLVNDDLTNFTASIDVPVLMLDRSLRVRRFTPQATRVVRIEDSDIGRLLEHLKLRVDVADLPGIAARVIETDTPSGLEVRDENGRWYTMSLRPYRSAEGCTDGVVIAFSDVDDLRRSADHLERRARLGDALTRIDAGLASTMEFDTIMQRALDDGVKAIGADAGAIEVREGAEWVVRYQNGFTPDDVGLRLTETEAPNATQAARTGEPLMITDMPADEHVYVGFVKAHGLKAVLAVPLLVRGDVVGCLLFYTRHKPRIFTAGEIDFGRRLGTSVSLALENSRLFHAEQDATQRAETLNAINEIIRSAITPQELLGRLVGEVSKVACADKSLVIEVHGDQFTITHVRNMRDDLVGEPRTADFFPGYALVARELRPVLIEDTWTDPRTNKDFVVPYKLRAVQLLPLIIDGSVVAVLALAYDEPRTFDAADEGFSERVSTAMSVALTNARLFESETLARREAKRELQTTALLLQAARVLLGPEDISTRLGALAGLVSSSLVHDRVVFTLWDEQTRLVRVVAVAGGAGPAQDVFAWEELSSPGRLAIETGCSAVIDYGQESEAVRGISQQAGFRLALAVPMVSARGTVGLILADKPSESVAFTEREIELLDSIAGQAATAVENARLFEAEQAARLSEEARAQRMGLLKEIADIASSSLDSHSVAVRVVEGVQLLLGAEQVQIRLVSEDGTSLVSEAVVDSADGYLATLGAIPVDAALETAACFRSKEIRFSDDVTQAKITKGSKTNARKSGIRAYALLPLVSRGEALGILYVAWTEPRGFSPEDLTFFEAVAAQFVVGLENALLFEAEVAARGLAKQELQTTTTLLEAATALARWTDLADVARGLAESLIRSTTHTRVIASVWHEADRELVVAASAGEQSLPVGGRWPIDQVSVAAQKAVLERQSNVWDLDVVSGPERGVAVDELQMHLALYVPLVQRDTVVGLLIVDDPGERREFSDRDIELVEAVGAQAAVAMENARLFEAEVAAQHRLTEELERTRSLFEAEQKSRQRVEALHELTELATSSLDLAEVADRALHYVHDELGVDVVTFWMLDDRGTRLFPVSGVGFPQAFYDGFASGVGLDDPFVIADAVKQGQPIVRTGGGIDQVPEPVRTSYAKYGVDLRTLLVLPVNGRAGVIGAVTLAWSTPHEMDADEIRFFSSVANELAIATENATLHAAKELELQRTITLAAVATAASSSLGLTEICQSVAEELRALPDVAAATIYSLEEERGVLRNLAVFGYPDDMDVWLSELPVDDSSNIGRVAASGLSLLTHQDPGNPAEVPSRLAHMGVPSARWISLPMKSAGRLMGVIGLIFHGERPFETQELTLFTGIADTLAAALANARLFETVQVELARTTILREVAAAAASTVNVHELSERALAACREQLGAKEGNVYLIDRDADVLVATALFGFPEEVIPSLERMDLDEARASARSYLRSEVVMHDTPDLPSGIRKRAKAAEALADRWVSVPIRSSNGVLGSLGLVFPGQRAFNSEEIALYEALADQLGIGLEKARLFEAEVEAQQRASMELATTTALLEAADAISQWTDLSDVVVGLARTVLRSTSRTRAIVDLWHEDRRGFEIVASEGDVPLPVGGFWSVDATSQASREAIFEKRISVVDYDAMPADARGVAADVYQAHLALFVPLVQRDRVVGLLIVDDPGSRREFTERETGLIAGIASQAAIAIANARLFEAEQTELARTTVLKEVAAIGACTFTVKELADGTLDALRRLLGATTGNLFVVDETARVLRSVSSFGVAEKARTLYREVSFDSDTASTRVALSGKLLTHEADVPGSARRVAKVTGAAESGWIILPVNVRGKTAGVLGLSFGDRRHFGDVDASFFESIAHQIGVGMDKAAMLETVSRQAELQRVIAEAAATLASSLEVEIAFPTVLDAASQALGASGAVLSVREPGMWRTAAVCGVRAERFDSVRVDEAAPSLMRVLKTREPLFVADVSTAEYADPALADRMGYHSFIAYPVLHRDEVTAVMAFSFTDVREPLTEAELGFLARLAFAIGVTDENARLYAREHRIASTLQEAILMPPDEVAGIETAHVYRPASNEANVGGDYYDVFSLDHEHVGIVVGDIAGKGIGAARLTSLLRDGIRAYAFETRDPAAVLGLANTLVHRSVSVGEFSTVFFGVLEIPTGSFRYSCAGHPPPMIAHADGTVSPLETRSPVLGAFEGVEFRLSEDVELAVGDTLVLYTDGVTEARRDREMFGEMRLMVTLAKLRGTPVSELPGALLSEVLDFSGGHLRDDTIILCVARTAESA